MGKQNKISKLNKDRLQLIFASNSFEIIVFLSKRKDARIKDIANHLNVPGSIIHKNLKQLIKVGIVRYDFKNHHSLYSLKRAAIVEAIDDVIGLFPK